METNFSFLESKKEYELFAGACIDAECILESSPVMSAVASRKALELGVKWVYSIDSALKPIGYREGLQSLLHIVDGLYFVETIAVHCPQWKSIRAYIQRSFQR
jgi:hypothetical protein